MKTLFLCLTCFVIVSCNSNTSSVDKQVLPWMIDVDGAGSTTVFGISPGNLSLSEFAQHFHELADVKLFQKPDNSLFLEAYLGKTKIGKFDARLVAELDAPQELLESVLASANGRKPTPNNYWQYNLNDSQLKQALKLRVWRFMYIPIADYQEKQIGFFGTPESIKKVTESAEYRYFPEKGVVVLWDQEEKETFYYSSPREFQRLTQALEDDRKSDAELQKLRGASNE